jgi:quinol-cytochrome oxidoreductase complex cytochrome b subunit
MKRRKVHILSLHFLHSTPPKKTEKTEEYRKDRKKKDRPVDNPASIREDRAFYLAVCVFVVAILGEKTRDER